MPRKAKEDTVPKVAKKVVTKKETTKKVVVKKDVAKVDPKSYIYATGRRKKSIARVKLIPGSGIITVNGKSLDDVFHMETLKMVVKQPLTLTNTTNQFDIIAKVTGGGFTGQAGAVRHGITRALVKFSEEYKPTLKVAGMLTRDPRMKERRKYGLKKARKASQFSKR